MEIKVNNMMAPVTMFDQSVSEQTKQLLGLLTGGHECIACEGDKHFNGNYYECSVSDYDCDDGLGHTLTYTYDKEGEFGLARLTGYQIERDRRFDGMFDITRERLEDVLKEYDKQYEDWNGMHELFVRIGGKFGIRL